MIAIRHIVLVLMLSLLCITGKAQQQHLLFKGADALFVNQSYPQAIRAFHAYLDQDSTIDLLEAESLIKIGVAYQELGRYDSAYVYFKRGYGAEYRDVLDVFLINLIPNVIQLYEQLSLHNAPFLDSLLRQAVSWRAAYVSIDSIKPVNDSVSLLYFPVTKSMGFDDEWISVFAHYNKALDRETQHKLGEGKLERSDTSGLVYRFTQWDVGKNDLQVRKNDLALFEVRSPRFSTDDHLAELLFLAVDLGSNYKEALINYALAYSSDYAFYRPLVMQHYRYSLHEIYDLFSDDTSGEYDVLHEPMVRGLYRGRSVMDVFENITDHDIDQFQRFVIDYSVKYMGLSWRFSETYATWLINNAPVSDAHFSDLLIAMRPEERQVTMRKYQTDQDSALIQYWIEQQLNMVSKNDFKKAIDYGDLITSHGLAYQIDRFIYYGKRHNAAILTDQNQLQKAQQLMLECSAYYKRIGDKDEYDFCERQLAFIRESTVDLVVQSGHGMPFMLEVHTNGQFYYTGGWDGMIKKYEVNTNLIIRSSLVTKGMINHMEMSKSGRYLIVASDDGEVLVLDPVDLSTIHRIVHPNGVESATIDPTDRLIAYCGYGSTAYVQDWKSNTEPIKLLKHKDDVTAVRFSRESGRLYTAGLDSMVYQWNDSLTADARWYRIHAPVLDLVLADNDQYFAVVTLDSNIHIWDNYRYRKMGQASNHVEIIGGSYMYTRPAFNPEGTLIVFGQSDARTLFFDMERFQDARFDLANRMNVTNYAFHPSGDLLFMASHDLRVTAIDVSNYVVGQNTTIYQKSHDYPSASTITIAHDEAGEKLLSVIYAGAYTYKMVSLDLTNGRSQVIDNDIYVGHSGGNFEQATQTVNITNMTSVVEFDVQGNEISRFPRPPLRFLSYYTTQSDLNRLYCVVNDSLIAYDYASGQLIYGVTLPFTLTEDYYGKKIEVLGRQGMLLIQNKQRYLYFFDLNTGRYIRKHKVARRRGKVEQLSFTPDQKHLLVYHTRGLRLIDLKTMKTIWRMKFGRDPEYDEMVTSMAVSNDTRHIAWGDMNYDVNILDRHTGEITKVDERFGWFITNMQFNPKYPYLVISAEDQKIVLYDYRSKKKLYLFAQRSGEYLMVDEHQYYWAPKEARSGAVFVQRDHGYTLDQFDVIYNRPDRVLGQLDMADKGLVSALRVAAEKRKLYDGQDGDAVLMQLPDLIVRDRDLLPVLTREREFGFEVSMTDYTSGLATLHVAVNGVPVKQLAIDGQVSEVDRWVSVTLTNGLNVIDVWCANEQGYKSIKQSIEVSANLGSKKPDLYLAVVSVSAYADSSYNLKYAVKDGRDLVMQFLTDSARYGNIYIDTLFNSNATLEGFRSIGAFIEQAGEGDQVMLYLSGHGLLDDSYDFYFAAHDVNFDRPEEKGISYTSIEDLFDHTSARRRLLIMDACHSGEVDKSEIEETDGLASADGMRSGIKSYSYRGAGVTDEEGEVGLENSFELMKEMFSSVNEKGIQIISAAAGNSYALESNEWKNGVFTYALINGLRSMDADIDNNGVITVSEWRDHVINKVYELTDGRQKPTVRQENIDFNFAIW